MENYRLPKLSARRGDTDEAWRLERLSCFHDGVARRASKVELGSQWHGAVSALHDHKGDLTVWWRSEQDWKLFRDLLRAEWRDLGQWVAITNKLGNGFISAA